MTTKRHVCFIVGTLSQGGAERQLYYMIRVLREGGHRLTVLCLTRGEYWEARIRELGVPVLWVGERQSRPRRLFRIVREVRHLRPDIIQSSHFYTNVPAALAGRVLGIPAIGAVRTDCLREVEGTGRIIGRLNLRLPRWIAGNSRAALRNARGFGVSPKRLIFLPNVVDCGEFQATVKNEHAPIRIVTAGRLVEQKRHGRFVRLISRLQSTVSTAVRGIIAGVGPKQDDLQRQVQDLRLSEEVFELSGLRQDMKDVYAGADIFVLTSDWEGTPNVVLEAMACGVPVVATDVGDVADLIPDGECGFVVPRNSEDDLAERVAQLVQNAERRRVFGVQARRHVEANYSLTRLAEQLAFLYRTVSC